MGHTSSPAPAGNQSLVQIIQAIEECLSRGELGDAFELLARARTLAESIGADVDQAICIADLITCSPPEELVEGTLVKVNAIEGVLDRVKERLGKGSSRSAVRSWS